MIRSLILSTLTLTTLLATPVEAGQSCRFRSMMDNGPSGVHPCRVVNRGGQLYGFEFPNQPAITIETPGYRTGGQYGQCLEEIQTNTSVCPVR